jgi:hypothetical protein
MKFFLVLASVSTIALLCSLMSAQHQIKDEYPLCQTSDAAIGECRTVHLVRRSKKDSEESNRTAIAFGRIQRRTRRRSGRA